MNPKLKKLYKEVILQHHKNPVNFQKMESASFTLEANNPLCGDRYTLYLKIDDNNIISNAYFHGFGCAISKASTSILVENLIGKTITEAKIVSKKFIDYVDGENRTAEVDKSFTAFQAVDEFPERRGCAVLAWELLDKEL